jgi:hypothetical protein
MNKYIKRLVLSAAFAACALAVKAGTIYTYVWVPQYNAYIYLGYSGTTGTQGPDLWIVANSGGAAGPVSTGSHYSDPIAGQYPVHNR